MNTNLEEKYKKNKLYLCCYIMNNYGHTEQYSPNIWIIDSSYSNKKLKEHKNKYFQGENDRIFITELKDDLIGEKRYLTPEEFINVKV